MCNDFILYVHAKSVQMLFYTKSELGDFTQKKIIYAETLWVKSAIKTFNMIHDDFESAVYLTRTQ